MSISPSHFSKDYIIQWVTQTDNLKEDKKIYVKANTYAYKEQFPDLIECEKTTKALPQEFQVELEFFRKNTSICYWAHLLNNTGKLLGFCIFEQKQKNCFYIREIAVTPEYWGKGLAPYLVFSILEKFPPTEKLFLATKHVNKRALSLYRKCGFNKINMRKYEGLSSFSELEFQGMEWDPKASF